MRRLTLLILVLVYFIKISSSSAGIPRCPLSLSAAWHDDNTTAQPTPNQCIKEPKVETVAVTITETITTDTLTLTTTVTSIETNMLLPAYATTSVPHTDHGCSQGDTMKGTTREKVLRALLGVFVVLFVTVTVGWMWSCWTSKRRAGVTTETAQTRINELNYDINLAYTQPQNSFNDPTVPQLQDNQAYAESQQLPQNSDEPVYERISDLSAKYAQVLALEGDREEDNPTKALSTDVSDQTSTTVKE